MVKIASGHKARRREDKNPGSRKDGSLVERVKEILAGILTSKLV